MSLFAALLLGFVTLQLAQAGFLRDTSQHGTDAAALAGAEAARDFYLNAATQPFSTADDWHDNISPTTCSSYGAVDAATLAQANDTDIRSYCLDTYRGEIHVITNATADDAAATTTGTAGYDINPYDCRLSITPTRTPTRTPTPTPTASPSHTPEPSLFTDGPVPHLTCGGHQVALRYAADQPGPSPQYAVKDAHAFKELLTPRLVK